MKEVERRDEGTRDHSALLLMKPTRVKITTFLNYDTNSGFAVDSSLALFWKRLCRKGFVSRDFQESGQFKLLYPMRSFLAGSKSSLS